jgi:hypothetical protein
MFQGPSTDFFDLQLVYILRYGPFLKKHIALRKTSGRLLDVSKLEG